VPSLVRYGFLHRPDTQPGHDVALAERHSSAPRHDVNSRNNMNEQTSHGALPPGASSYRSRVLQSDAFKKGAAAGFAGLVVALVTEAMWPTSS